MQVKLSSPILNVDGEPFTEGPEDKRQKIIMQDALLMALKQGHDRADSPTITQVADDLKLARRLSAKVDEISLPSEKVAYLKERLVKMIPNAGWDRVFVGCIIDQLEPVLEEVKEAKESA